MTTPTEEEEEVITEGRKINYFHHDNSGVT
jgi:hypothetical protein